MPAVSIIIPVYNAENYIQHTLNNVTRQTLKDIEIVCIDDGSRDMSLQKVSAMQQRDKRIKIFHQDNQGAGGARNFGIEKATGEYIAFMDADDEYPTDDVLELLYTKAKNNNADVCGGSVTREDSWENEGQKEAKRFKSEGWMEYYDYQVDYWFTRYIFKRMMLINGELKFPVYRMNEDPVFLLRVMDTVKKFYAIPNSVYKQNESHSSAGRFSVEQEKDYLRGVIDNMRFSATHGYKIVYVNNCRRLFYDIAIKAEKRIWDCEADQEYFELLLKANGLIFCEYLEGTDLETKVKEGLLPLELIWNTSNKYLKIRRLFRIFERKR